MRPGWRMRRQHLFGHHIAFELRALVAAVFLRPSHADPPLGPDFSAEFAREPALATMRRQAAGLGLLVQKIAYFLAQFLGFGRQFDRVETEARRHRGLVSLE